MTPELLTAQEIPYGAVSLGIWMPSDIGSSTDVYIGWRKLFVNDHDVVPSNYALQVRNPEQSLNITGFKGEARTWHRDRMDEYITALNIALWASTNPTEIKIKGWGIYVPQPFEMIVIDNLRCLHRAPEHQSEDRWFARAMFIKQQITIRKEDK